MGIALGFWRDGCHSVYANLSLLLRCPSCAERRGVTPLGVCVCVLAENNLPRVMGWYSLSRDFVKRRTVILEAGSDFPYAINSSRLRLTVTMRLVDRHARDVRTYMRNIVRVRGSGNMGNTFEAVTQLSQVECIKGSTRH